MAYIGKKFSENYLQSRKSGMKPLSAFNRADFENLKKENSLLKKYSFTSVKNSMKKIDLSNSFDNEWHHTGKFYNKTTVYNFNKFADKQDFNKQLIFNNNPKAKEKHEVRSRKNYLTNEQEKIRDKGLVKYAKKTKWLNLEPKQTLKNYLFESGLKEK